MSCLMQLEEQIIILLRQDNIEHEFKKTRIQVSFPPLTRCDALLNSKLAKLQLV